MWGVQPRHRGSLRWQAHRIDGEREEGLAVQPGCAGRVRSSGGGGAGAARWAGSAAPRAAGVPQAAAPSRASLAGAAPRPKGM
jgi:hypothetical protein